MPCRGELTGDLLMQRGGTLCTNARGRPKAGPFRVFSGYRVGACGRLTRRQERRCYRLGHRSSDQHGWSPAGRRTRTRRRGSERQSRSERISSWPTPVAAVARMVGSCQLGSGPRFPVRTGVALAPGFDNPDMPHIICAPYVQMPLGRSSCMARRCRGCGSLVRTPQCGRCRPVRREMPDHAPACSSGLGRARGNRAIVRPKRLIILVGAAGFEPTTPSPPD